MRPYLSVWKLRFILGMQYRSAALAGIATQLFFGLIFLMIFQAFYSGSAAEPPMPLDRLVSYVWLQQIFLSLIMLWFRDNEIFQLITSGNVAYELCRPCGLYSFWYAKLLGQRLSSATLRCFPILLIVFFLPKPFRQIPGSVWLPNVGLGALTPELEGYFRTRLDALTKGDRGRGLLFYCLADCWMSWNAAKRALEMGYGRVYWFRDGVDGWAEAGLPTEEAKPVPMADR